MKKVCCLLFALVLGCLLVFPLQASAETEGIYEYTVSDGKATITDCDQSVAGDLIIPDTLGGYPVTAIGDDAFRWRSSLTSVTIPDSVTTICNSAFAHCSSLTTVTIPYSLTTIGEDAFFFCTSLTSVTIPDSVTAIGDGAFFCCNSLTGIWVSENNPVYSGDASGVLYDKGKTTLLEAPDGISGNCTIPDSVTTIDGGAFSYCERLTTVTIPVSVTTIGHSAFFNCTSLTDVYYAGTKAQWGEIQIDGWNECLTEEIIHYAAAQTGDLDGNAEVNEDDAIYLLQYVLMPDLFPVEQAVDYDGSGEINEDDAIYLLQHVLMPDLFPLEPAAPEASGVMTYAQYMDAELDAPVTVECYVQATQSWWNDTVTVYAQDHDGGYFIYEMDCTEADAARLTPGTKIRVSGYKAEWRGEIEILDSTFEFIDGADTFVAAPLDVTPLIGTEELIAHQNQKVVFKGMTIDQIAYKNDEPGDDIYITASKDGVTCSFMVERYLTDPDTEVYKAFAELKSGDVVDLEGFLYWYEGANPHITAVSKVS